MENAENALALDYLPRWTEAEDWIQKTSQQKVQVAEMKALTQCETQQSISGPAT